MRNRPKLCLILPIYDEGVWGHSQHIYRLVERLGLSVDIFLIFETGRGRVNIGNCAKIITQKFRRKPWSQAELLLILLRARLSGYRFFFSYFSVRPALYSKLITFLFHGTTYLFHCAEFKKKDLTDTFFKKSRLCWVLRHIDWLVTTTPLMARHYVQEFGVDRRKIKLVPYWVDTQQFERQSKSNARKKLGIDSGTKLILFVHQLSKSKGAHHLPRIAQLVAEEVSNTVFLVVGGPSTANDVSHILKKNVLEKGLANVIRLEGKVPNKDIQTYFAAADLFIMPSDEEGFGIVLLEAMASGVPFVATDGGGPVMDVVSPVQRRFVVPAGDMVSFSQKIIQLLSSEEERKLLIEDGRRHVQRYSLDEALATFRREIILNP